MATAAAATKTKPTKTAPKAAAPVPKATTKKAAAPAKPQARTNTPVKGGNYNLPSKQFIRDAADMNKLIGDPTRLSILLMLDQTEMNVGQICGALEQSQPAISHHLALLRHAKAVAVERDGKNNIYRLADSTVKGLIRSIAASANA